MNGRGFLPNLIRPVHANPADWSGPSKTAAAPEPVPSFGNSSQKLSTSGFSLPVRPVPAAPQNETFGGIPASSYGRGPLASSNEREPAKFDSYGGPSTSLKLPVPMASLGGVPAPYADPSSLRPIPVPMPSSMGGVPPPLASSYLGVPAPLASSYRGFPASVPVDINPTLTQPLLFPSAIASKPADDEDDRHKVLSDGTIAEVLFPPGRIADLDRAIKANGEKAFLGKFQFKLIHFEE